MMFMPVFSSYAITMTMGDMSSNVFGAKIATLFDLHNYGYGSALSFVLLLLVVAVMFIGSYFSGRTAKTLKRGKVL